MAIFRVTSATTAGELKEQFRREVGGVILVYNGASEAAESVTLLSIGANEGELELPEGISDSEIEQAFGSALNLKVSAFTNVTPGVKSGLFGYRVKVKWALRWVIEPKYDDAKEFCGKVAPVSENGKWGLIDKAGEWVVEPVFEEIGVVDNGMASARENGGKWGLIDMSGEWIVRPAYDEIGQPVSRDKELFDRNGLVRVKIDRQYALIDRNGNLVVAPDYDRIDRDGDYYLAARDHKRGMIDSEGKVIVPMKYEDLRAFSEGLAPAKEDGKWGYIDENDDRVIAAIFDSAGSFNDGHASISYAGTALTIDRNGLIGGLTPQQYVEGNPALSGYARSLELASKSVVGWPLHLMGDGFDDRDKERQFIDNVFISDGVRFIGANSLSQEQIAELMAEHPDYTRIYYSNDDPLLSKKARSAYENDQIWPSDRTMAEAVTEAVSNQRSFDYPPLAFDLIYDGEIICSGRL